MTFVDPHRRDVTQDQPEGCYQTAEVSDAWLAAAARTGDGDAALVLVARHAPAVSALADEVGPERYQASIPALVELVSTGEPLGAPLRVVWLRLLSGAQDPTRLLEPRWGRDLVYSAFTALPEAWQTVVWHHVVEGDSTRDMGRLLGMGDFEARRALSGAASALRRTVARAHETGPTAACDEIATRLLHDAASLIPHGALVTLREHAKSCDPCLHLARDLFTLEHGLADVLVARVLGPLAPAYLRSRPASRSLGSAPRVGGLPPVAARAARPAALIGLSGVAAAAVFSAMTLGSPGLIDGDRVLLAAPDQVVGRVLEREGIEPVARLGEPASRTGLARDATVGDESEQLPGGEEQVADAADPSSPGSPGVTPDVPPTDGPVSPDVPEVPVQNPEPPIQTPQEPQAPAQPPITAQTPVGDVSVEVDLAEGDVAVQVGGVTVSPDLPGLDDVVGDDGPVSSVVGGLLGG